MARQDGIIRLQGEMGGISFYKSSLDGHLARQKGGVDAKRIQNDPAFARTRENGAEFGRAGEAGKLLRTALRALILNTSDSRMTSRLTKKFTQVIQGDITSNRGLRNVTDGNVALLENFDFNTNGKLNRTLFAPYTATIDRVAGTVTINVPAFIAANMIAAPTGATHFKLVAAATEIDFGAAAYVVDTAESTDTVLDVVTPAAINLAMTLTPGNTDPLFLAFGIEFAQLVNGGMYALNNGAYNALALVAVDAGA